MTVDLADPTPPPKYQQIAERAAHLRELGMTYRAIGEALGVDRKLAAKTLAWREKRLTQRGDSLPDPN